MFHATVQFTLETDCVLSEVTSGVEGSFAVTHEHVLDAERVAFVINAGDHAQAFTAQFVDSPQVESVEPMEEGRLLVTKYACGALPIIHRNHGMIQGTDTVDGSRRVFDLVVYRREDLRNIIDGLRAIGTARVTRLSPYNDWLNTLSDRQAEVVALALEAGYYDWPRRIDAQELASRLDVTHATVLEHLRKAERKLIGEALSRGRAGGTAGAAQPSAPLDTI